VARWGFWFIDLGYVGFEGGRWYVLNVNHGPAMIVGLATKLDE
jgi:hypothetical protein